MSHQQKRIIPSFLLLSAILFAISGYSQKASHIDWSKDTISSTTANNAHRNFANSLNGTGKKATTQVNLPVDKLKDILDACAANGIDIVKVMIVSIRQEDIAHYSYNNPGLSDANKADLIGRQILVFRVPRRAFAGAAGSKINISKSNPLMLSLAGSGLIWLEYRLAGLPAGGEDLYFTFGGICPPPNICD